MVTTITALFLKRGMGGCCDVDEGDRKRGIYRSKESVGEKILMININNVIFDIFYYEFKSNILILKYSKKNNSYCYLMSLKINL